LELENAFGADEGNTAIVADHLPSSKTMQFLRIEFFNSQACHRESTIAIEWHLHLPFYS
jgi:hypothetical protein